jgi:hypothetical protein
MIVAIVNQTAPVGEMRVEEFRTASSEAAAVDDFVNGYKPPHNPADYLGYDTGWSDFQKPTAGFFWAYDFGSPGLVQVATSDRFEWRGAILVVSNAEAASGATPFAWETMAQFSADLSFAYKNISKGQIRIWGRYKADKGGGAGPTLRLAVGNVDLGVPLLLADQSAWTNFVFWTTAALDPGRKLYSLQAKLNNASATLEIDATSMVLLEKQF